MRTSDQPGYSAGYEQCWRDLSITLNETLSARVPIVVEQTMQIMAAKADPRNRGADDQEKTMTKSIRTSDNAGERFYRVVAESEPLLSALALRRWQPIETAPHDDGIYDWWLDWADDCRSLNLQVAGALQADEQRFRGRRGAWPSYLTATYWMPLPAPPPNELDRQRSHEAQATP